MSQVTRFLRAGIIFLLLSLAVAAPAKGSPSRPEPASRSLPVFGIDKDFQPSRMVRIIGGVDVSYGWQVSLGAGNGPMIETASCGGTLIARDLVLTAAHCVFDDDGRLFPEIQNYGLQVLIGQSRLSGGGGELREASEIWTWGAYDSKTLEWDVALLELGTPSSRGTPIRIAGGDERALWGEGRPVWASGWGRLASGSSPDHMKGTWLTVVGDAPCRAAWRQSLDWSTQFCAGAPPSGGRATCKGDSGGPLVARSRSGVNRLVGVTSFGYVKQCGGFRPDGFAKVAAEPIRSTVQSLVSQIRPSTSVIGSGEALPPPIDSLDARSNAGIYVGWACDVNRYCASAKVRTCRRTGSRSFQCAVSQYLQRGGRRFTGTRAVSVIDRGSRVTRKGIRSWKVIRGWR